MIGAIGACHLNIKPIKGKEDHMDDYVNASSEYSIILLAVADYDKKFTYIDVENPGSVTLEKAYHSSSLYERMEENARDLFPRLSHHMVGDTVFPLNKHLLVPYDKVTLSRQESMFNSKILKVEALVYDAFKSLKKRFKRLSLMGLNYKSVVKTCCVLHNIIISFPEEKNILTLKEQSESILPYENFNFDNVPQPPSDLTIRKREYVSTLFADS